MDRKERSKSVSKKRKQTMTFETISIHKGLLAQLLEAHLEAIKKIRHDDRVQIEFPWAEDLIPVKLGTYQDKEVLHIKHA